MKNVNNEFCIEGEIVDEVFDDLRDLMNFYCKDKYPNKLVLGEFYLAILRVEKEILCGLEDAEKEIYLAEKYN